MYDSDIKYPARLIEADTFPVDVLSLIAERESWRKEIYCPLSHIHKWWAQRLGCVFRAILLACQFPEGANLFEEFYKRHDFSGTSILDPFMGSGTTITEAHKLGYTTLGRDINPVACESVRVALGTLDHKKLQDAFKQLSSSVGERIRDLYKSVDRTGQVCDVLYYFWVKTIVCPECETQVDLFSTRVVARNACPERRPEIVVCCPSCGDLFRCENKSSMAHCCSCGLDFDPLIGSASGPKAICTRCSSSFPIIKAVRASKKQPEHRLYGKLLLTPDGGKIYLSTTTEDERQYQRCSELLESQVARGTIRLPDAVLSEGFNTRQAMNYNYFAWRDFFNDRQLLALGWLHEAITLISDIPTRDALLTLFSGLLEFNNMFATYKGEGTGAVRHMFSHHILKPERMPIEANVWGTEKSSGSFLNLFRTRLLRAIEYRQYPFEPKVGRQKKDYRSNPPFSGEVNTTWPTSGHFKQRGIYLSCGSSDQTGLPDKSVDIVATDPPFFDNVHYSELADFFYAWQTLCPRGFINGASTTRHPCEVQDVVPEQFATKLRNVFFECHRVLKDNGLLVLTYHHSRPEGWTALGSALFGAGFKVVNAHPVKGEMSVAAPKFQSKEPIQLDVILVCKKSPKGKIALTDFTGAVNRAVNRASEKLLRLSSVGMHLSRGDCRVSTISQFLAEVGSIPSSDAFVEALHKHKDELSKVADGIYETISSTPKNVVNLPDFDSTHQMELPFIA
jgi:putative DNA methylase